MRRFWSSLLGLGLAAAFVAHAHADEGQWTPDQIAQLDQAQLKTMGLELTPRELWNAAGDEKTGGLMRAAINLGGCSAAFISAEGLIATNHHCAYSALQANSTPEHDYLKDGFLAASRGEELEAKGRPVRVLRKIRDVSAEVEAAAETGADDDAKRALAIDGVEKELVATCEQTPGTRCTVASFYNGKEYRLFEYVELPDVRLVYAPPAAVGEYGGEVDNWMWPRHTGDFSLLRAYVGPDGAPADFSPENVPYEPARFLEVSTEGVGPGDFVAVLGYPGRTRRYMPAPEVARWVEQVLPFTVDFYGEWIEILEAHGARDEAVKIKVAATKKGLANRHKNSRGMLDGIEHMKLVDRRREEDQKLASWVADGHDEYADVLPALEVLSKEARAGHERDTLLASIARGPNSLAVAIDLSRRSAQLGLPDLERRSQYMDRNAKALWKRQERRLRDFDAAVDAEVLAMFLARNAALPEDQRITALTAIAPDVSGDREAFLPAATKLVDGSKFSDAKWVDKRWNGSPDAATKGNDPLSKVAVDLAEELDALDAREDGIRGRHTRLYPRYFEMLEAARKGPIYPDANGTLRFSYASVKGYDKWDGSPQSPQTVLAGAVAKHTGDEPFDLPETVRAKADAAKDTYWADPVLGDVPLCFLSTGDTTGGNSGSPMVDGKGRLVGFNFDRVWENIAGDFGYNSGHSRNVTADVRYLLWMLDEVADAGHLLEEMGVADKRGQPRRPKPEVGVAATSPDAAATKPKTKAPDAKSSGCACSTGPAGSPPIGSLGGLLLVGLLVPRRRRSRVCD